MPRLLHTSDLHLNALRKYPSYLLRMEGTLRNILRVAKLERVDVIVVAGDICDRLDMTHFERQLLSEWLASAEIPIVAISGNHDKRTEEIGDTCISYLTSLRSRFTGHIIYDGPPTSVELLGFRFLLLPYQGWSDQELYLIIESLLANIPVDDPLPNIVVMHEAVYGCVNDAGRTVTKHNQIRLDSSFPRITYWALGDMHLRQQVLTNAWYCGAPHQIKFDDIANKGLLIVDTDYPTDPKFVPIPSPQLLVLTEAPSEGWPGPKQALIQYAPSINAAPLAHVPSNVQLHPSMLAQSLSEQKIGASAEVLDGLDNVLARTGLDRSLFPLAWRIAVKMVADLGIDAKIPPEYAEKEL